jgi:hypothetical protein
MAECRFRVMRSIKAPQVAVHRDAGNDRRRRRDEQRDGENGSVPAKS